MVKFEIIAYYTRGVGFCSMRDEELCTPVHEVSNEEANNYAHMFEDMGMKRRENSNQFFYEEILDSTHSREYVFYK